MTSAGVLMALALIGALAMAFPGQSQIGKAAPAFSAVGSDGKTHTLASLSKGSTLVLYFIGHDCPVNAEAIKHYNAIASAYKNNPKVRFVGVINGDAKVFSAWNAKQKVPYLVLMDPDLKIIRSYKAVASPWVVRIANGKISHVQEGFSKGRLSELSGLMAKDGGVSAAKLTFTGAPAQERFG